MFEYDQVGQEVRFFFRATTTPCSISHTKGFSSDMSDRNQNIVLITLMAGTGLTLGFLWLSSIPLGIPGEWTWVRIPYAEESATSILLGMSISLFLGIILVSVCFAGYHRMEKSGWFSRFSWMGLMIAASMGWTFSLQDVPPAPFDLTKPVWVLYYPSSSGYFYQARYEMRDVNSFLNTYEERMSQGDVLHIGTHPPGLFLFHRFLLNLCETSASLTNIILLTAPTHTTEALRIINHHAHIPLKPSHQAGIWLAVLITQGIALATVVPLFLLIRLQSSAKVAWMCCSFWPFTPALSIFLPKSDALYPFLGTLFLWLWMRSLRFHSLKSAVLAGVVLWIGMMLSLALLPAVLLAASFTLLEIWKQRDDVKVGIVKIMKPTVAFLLGFTLPLLLLQTQCELNMINVWWWNYRNHAGFYAQYPRTWWKWLLVNPFEAGLAVGFPIILLVVLALCQSEKTGKQLLLRRVSQWLPMMVWGLLWLSGKNMGEAARLWLVLYPWFLWMITPFFERGRTEESNSETEADMRKQLHFVWQVTIIVQMLVCLFTVMRVSGFHLTVS